MDIATLPAPIALYLDQDNHDRTDHLDRCFCVDAVVRDEGREHRGLDAIAAWKRGAKARYRYRVEPLSATPAGERIALRVRASGDFPGSPVELSYSIVLRDGLIAELEIG